MYNIDDMLHFDSFMLWSAIMNKTGTAVNKVKSLLKS